MSKIEIKKSGTWAVGGFELTKVKKGEVRDFGPAENELLVDSGWAEWNAPDSKVADAGKPKTAPEPGKDAPKGAAPEGKPQGAQ
ncbi:hypothetical protein [Pseudomonas arsenicoxydans]|uniref:Uncharacterized protein n=1 Tax=Pseudomonas arsenicoxydans TaxID=702115 RepID=A0A502HT08_9PSED|nr:hypothetical protein [Pseudomonas arsenicoxydans]TPG76318.1 hypothetical protein EAH78_18315 [Pseudomonas arsenicoxydans]